MGPASAQLCPSCVIVVFTFEKLSRFSMCAAASDEVLRRPIRASTANVLRVLWAVAVPLVIFLPLAWRCRPEIMSIAFASAVEHMDFQQACVMESEGRQVVATIVQENLTSVFQKRVVPLQDNEFVQPLPAVSDDPVGLDISNIPKVVRQIQVRPRAHTLRALRTHAWVSSRPACIRRWWWRASEPLVPAPSLSRRGRTSLGLAFTRRRLPPSVSVFLSTQCSLRRS